MQKEEVSNGVVSVPHKGIVLIRYENYPRMLNGKISGRPTNNSSVLFEFNGGDSSETHEKAIKFLKDVEELYNNKYNQGE